MTHSEIQEALAVYRDLRGPERIEVDQHMAGCAECSALLNTYRIMDRDLSGLRDARPDIRLRQGLSAAISHDKAARDTQPARRTRTHSVMAPLAGVALLLVIVAGALAAWQGWLPGLGATSGRPFGTALPTPRSSLVGSFVWQTDGAYGYRMLRPAGWGSSEPTLVRSFIAPGWRAVGGVSMQVTSLAAQKEMAKSDAERDKLLGLFEQDSTLEGWTSKAEEEVKRGGWHVELLRTLPEAKIYTLSGNRSVSIGELMILVGYRIDAGQPLVITLSALGAYANLDRLQAEGIVDDLVTMVESAQAIPVDPQNVVPELAQATATPQPAQRSSTPDLIALGTPMSPQAQPDWEGAQITLNIFSGRPDPTWRLPAEEAQKLRGLLDPLPEVACRPMDLQLGYRGFVVVLGQRPELSNEYRLRVHDGQVRWGDPWDPQAPETCRSDADRQVERFLLNSGQSQLTEEIYALVAAEIGQAALTQRYSDPNYDFAFTYPSTWTLEDRTDPHWIRLRQGDFVLSIGVKRSGETTTITRSGVGAGDLVARGGVTFLGQALSRDVLVYQERDKEVLYNRAGEVAAGSMIFTLSLDYGGAAPPAPSMPYQDLVLPQEIQADADRIVASFSIEPRPEQTPPDNDAPGWTRYVATYGGLSFAYPPGWRLPDPGKPPAPGAMLPYQLIASPNDFPGGNLVQIIYLSYEIRPEQSLADWVAAYESAAGAVRGTASLQTGSITEPDARTHDYLQQVVKDARGITHNFFLRQGRLVILLQASTTEQYADRMAAALKSILTTFRFAPGAATTLNELYGTNRQWPTLGGDSQMVQPSGTVTPRCDVVCQDATAAAALALTPVPTLTQSPSFRATEEAYNWHVSATQTRQAQITPTTTPTPTSTPTPRPAGPGLAIYDGTSTDAPQPKFQLVYATTDWKQSAEGLEHQTIAGCSLWLHPPARGMAGPMRQEQRSFGGYTWDAKVWLPLGTTSYTLNTDRKYFLLELRWPKDVDQTVADRCRQAGEGVLDTFKMVD